MKILGIDTSTPCGSVGFITDDQVVCEYLLNIPVTHSERLLEAIDLVLSRGGCTIGDVSGWAISLGPGSFTGLRIGVSTIKGLAFATGKPVAGVSTLDVLASQISPTPYLICPIIDARKTEVYTAFYRFGEGGILERQSEYGVMGPQELAKRINERTIFVGDGIKIYGDLLRNCLPTWAIFPSAPFHVPHGSVVAKLGLERLRQREALDLTTFTPLYIRPSEAEMNLFARRAGQRAGAQGGTQRQRPDHQQD
jgi:tRNA threonylcarbamoyladenosine biosynthesis protein TsaB